MIVAERVEKRADGTAYVQADYNGPSVPLGAEGLRREAELEVFKEGGLSYSITVSGYKG